MEPAIKSKANIRIQNWSNNFHFNPYRIFYVSHEDEVKRIIQLSNKSNRKVRVMGSKLSPSSLILSLDFTVNLDNLNRVIEINTKKKQIVVEAGIKLKDLNIVLDRNNLAFENLGSISDQSIGGILGTPVHGTGLGYGSLANHVIEISYFDGLGNYKTIDLNDGELFRSYLCNLGVLGIITKVKLQLVEQFNLDIHQYPILFDRMVDEYLGITQRSEYARFWWFPHVKDINCFAWTANKTKKEEVNTGILERIIRVNIYELLLFIGKYVPSIIPWINSYYYQRFFKVIKKEVRLSYRGFNFDCLFQQNVNEWAIPIQFTKQALNELNQLLLDQELLVHFPIEIRFVKKEDILISPAYNQDVCYIGIIMYKPFGAEIEYQKYFDLFELIMKKYNGRPHWAKPHGLKYKELSQLYPKYSTFLNIRKQNDPNDLFLNDYLKKLLLK
ncbi:L-gulonolactone/D-arabinono-1,4-lactone oxidase [Neoconidiobolus thromboides FSU 785]|nr:L-gulonolactone/D-arabinono-1,4-lactone oxidase [Neoconidiobolus thromboides FSU 785]